MIISLHNWQSRKRGKASLKRMESHILKLGLLSSKTGKFWVVAHRGEVAANHAEFIALEKKLPDAVLAGATVYTTLEPCTTRNHPKILAPRGS
jgi:hypothetical protein